MRRTAATTLAALLAACPARLPPVTRPAAPEGLVAPAARARRETPAGELVLHADGSVTARGALVARVEPARVTAADGQVLATRAPDGILRVAGSARTLRLEGDALVRDDGARALREPDGRVTLRDPRGESAASPWRLDEVSPPSGTAVALLVVVLLDGPLPAPR